MIARLHPESESDAALTSASRLNVLFIARAFPPTVGGMENFAFRLSEHLRAFADITILANRRGKKALPVFLPAAVVRAMVMMRTRRIDVIHLADALLAPVGVALRAATHAPVTASVCGLDVTYPLAMYQRIIPASLRQLDALMPISAATEREVRARTGDGVRSSVIPLGINPLPAATESDCDEFRRLAGVCSGQRVVLTVGRLVPRKGAAWFARYVLPLIRGDVMYVVVGDGPERESILSAARDVGVRDRVRLTGRLDDRLVAAAYSVADVFVMPNIPIPGDMEGFGLVALEASAAGLPVIASHLEGISEALRDGANALLLAPEQPEGFARAVNDLLARPEAERYALGARFQSYTRREYGWERTARAYAELMTEVAGVRRSAA